MYLQVWSYNFQENSEEIAKKTFMELEKHKNAVEETKATLQNYVPRVSEQISDENTVNVNDLLALGEEVSPQKSPTKKKTKSRRKQDSDSEVEDWEEVKGKFVYLCHLYSSIITYLPKCVKFSFIFIQK